eukprot:scaffold68804_cov61-Phaeocystis_antarctica.AAC.4
MVARRGHWLLAALQLVEIAQVPRCGRALRHGTGLEDSVKVLVGQLVDGRRVRQSSLSLVASYELHRAARAIEARVHIALRHARSGRAAELEVVDEVLLQQHQRVGALLPLSRGAPLDLHLVGLLEREERLQHVHAACARTGTCVSGQAMVHAKPDGRRTGIGQLAVLAEEVSAAAKGLRGEGRLPVRRGLADDEVARLRVEPLVQHIGATHLLKVGRGRVRVELPSLEEDDHCAAFADLVVGLVGDLAVVAVERGLDMDRVAELVKLELRLAVHRGHARVELDAVPLHHLELVRAQSLERAGHAEDALGLDVRVAELAARHLQLECALERCGGVAEDTAVRRVQVREGCAVAVDGALVVDAVHDLVAEPVEPRVVVGPGVVEARGVGAHRLDLALDDLAPLREACHQRTVLE